MGRPTPVGGVDLLAMDVFIEPQGVAARPICEIGRLLDAVALSRVENDFAWTLGTLNRFFGILEIRASGNVAATAVQTRPGQFATLPVARLPD